MWLSPQQTLIARVTTKNLEVTVGCGAASLWDSLEPQLVLMRGVRSDSPELPQVAKDVPQPHTQKSDPAVSQAVVAQVQFHQCLVAAEGGGNVEAAPMGKTTAPQPVCQAQRQEASEHVGAALPSALCLLSAWARPLCIHVTEGKPQRRFRESIVLSGLPNTAKDKQGWWLSGLPAHSEATIAEPVTEYPP